MTLSENVAKLHTLLPVLKASDAKFAADLIASYKKYGSLTPKQAPWIERLILRAETPAPVFSPSLGQTPAPVANVGGFAGVIALFTKAKEHLKFPKIRLVVEGKHIVLSVNGPKSKTAGSISITSEGAYGARFYYGRVSPEGVFTPANSVYGDFLTALTALLTKFAANPARVAKDHGKLTGHCCFCNKELGLGEDQRSVAVGFGPVCADHYGLKAEWNTGAAKAEAAAGVAGLATEAAQEVITDAQVSEWVAPLAESLQEELAAEEALVTGEFSPQVWEVDNAQVTAWKDGAALVGWKYCFFCEQLSLEVKVLHDKAVCTTCRAQLGEGN